MTAANECPSHRLPPTFHAEPRDSLLELSQGNERRSSGRDNLPRIDNMTEEVS